MGQITVEKNAGGIEGLCVITPAVHGDNRGYFMETYSQRDMAEHGLNMVFVQDNQSMSAKGVLRGLHFQRKQPQSCLHNRHCWPVLPPPSSIDKLPPVLQMHRTGRNHPSAWCRECTQQHRFR